MFVKVAEPRAVGTVVRFKLDLGGRPRQTIEGTGEVAWIRLRSQGPDAPPGMGIQFRYLDKENRERLRAEVGKVIAELGLEGESETPTELIRRREPPSVERRETTSAAPTPRTPKAPKERTKPEKKPSGRRLAGAKARSRNSDTDLAGRRRSLFLLLALGIILLFLLIRMLG